MAPARNGILSVNRTSVWVCASGLPTVTICAATCPNVALVLWARGAPATATGFEDLGTTNLKDRRFPSGTYASSDILVPFHLHTDQIMLGSTEGGSPRSLP